MRRLRPSISGVFYFMKQEEIWKDIPNYEGLYQASNFGNVRSLPKVWDKGMHQGKKLQAGLSDKYLTVALFKNKIKRSYRVHVLVAMAFLNHKPCGMKLVIDHINDNTQDNRVENLQIVTNRFNCRKKQGKYSSQYKGVSWNKQKQKWKSEIYINKKIIFLGYFDCELKASESYQNKLKEIL